MNNSHTRKIFIVVLLVTLGAGGLFVSTLIQALFDTSRYAEEENISTQNTASVIVPIVPTPPSVGPVEMPGRLLIPELSIDAEIQHVGLTASGAIGIPTNFTDVAWYKHGTVPGQLGSAIIDGHVDNGLALAAVFKNLHTLAPGDIVSVITEKDTQLDFEVEKIENYSYKEVPLDAMLNATDAQRLVLITCSGEWIGEKRTYDSRLVVYTKRIEKKE